VCHQGTVSCFTRPLPLGPAGQTADKKEESRG
jgi:hypothetical protein